jgi:hypothetical protein
MYFKAPDNSIHQIEPEFAHLLPAGSVQITDAEAAAIRAANQPVVDPKDAIRAQIKSMEDRENLPRVSREFMLGTFEAQFPANVLAQHEGYARLKAFDTQIKALRDQL